MSLPPHRKLSPVPAHDLISDTDASHPAKRVRLTSPSPPPASTDVEMRTEDESSRDVPVDTISQPSTSATPVPGPVSNLTKKGKSKARKGKKNLHAAPEHCSNEDVIARDVAALLGQDVVDGIVEEGKEWDAPFLKGEKVEVEVEVQMMCSNGEGLAILPGEIPWAILVPFSLPGELVKARVYRHSRLHSLADLVSVIRSNPELRDDTRVKCRYFANCAGCQYQMLSYDKQLELKRDVVVKAYSHYFDAPASLLPEIGSTAPSHLQYGYRTKITPHFDAPHKKYIKAPETAPLQEDGRPEFLKVGFNEAGTRHVMDIEECPIATPVINERLKTLRAEIAQNIYTYKKGVSLILRDSLPIPDSSAVTEPTVASIPVASTLPDAAASNEEEDQHIAVTDHRSTVRERVKDLLFEYPAHSFFQNNNSVLGPLVDYVRDSLLGPSSASTSSDASAEPKLTHLVDAYCGAGLFALSLARSFEVVAGIELSAESIAAATRNAELNSHLLSLPASADDATKKALQVTFRAGDASAIFASVPDFPAHQTALIIDPPRKGTDEAFLRQMVKFGAKRVVYVSCNVHTQARDLGMLMKLMEEDSTKRRGEGKKGRRYVVESLRGWDLFPQTAHVESVAVLRLVEE